MVAGDRDRISGDVSRLRREDCSRTKHDREFSKWEILIGACDWEDYSLGKEGAERYRVHNLPKNSGPGVYELGIAACRTGLGREIGKTDPDRIVVVYLGQADNVRTRLQHYGRSGSHLGSSASISVPHDCKPAGPQKGPGLFEEILSSGYPIVFRWAAMQSKTDALRTETRLLNTFDYAWNASTNGTRRPDDVLQKLNKISSSAAPSFAEIARKLVPFGQRQVGVRIEAGKSSSVRADGESSQSLLSRVFKFGKSRPRLLVRDGTAADVQDGGGLAVCGVVSGGPDSICQRPPVEGKKRCSEHKGMRVKTSSDVFPQSEATCGFVSADGSPCRSRPVRGNKRCDEHKGRQVYKPDPAHPVSRSDMSEIGLPSRPNNMECGNVCGVILGDGLVCTERPVVGRVRCEEHKGMRVNRLASKSSF